MNLNFILAALGLFLIFSASAGPVEKRQTETSIRDPTATNLDTATTLDTVTSIKRRFDTDTAIWNPTATDLDTATVLKRNSATVTYDSTSTITDTITVTVMDNPTNPLVKVHQADIDLARVTTTTLTLVTTVTASTFVSSSASSSPTSTTWVTIVSTLVESEPISTSTPASSSSSTSTSTTSVTSTSTVSITTTVPASAPSSVSSSNSASVAISASITSTMTGPPPPSAITSSATPALGEDKHQDVAFPTPSGDNIPSNDEAAEAVSKAVHTGDLTYYQINGGATACGKYPSDSDSIVSLGHALFDKYTPDGNSNHNTLCGKMITINCGGKTHQAKVSDRCGQCAEWDIDVTAGVFTTFAPESVGRLHGVHWHFD